MHRDNVLGTSLDVTINHPSEQLAHTALESMLEHVSSMESVLSTYQANSAISQLNRDNYILQAPRELREVTQLCEQWFVRSGKTFSCRMGQVIRHWDNAEEHNRRPERPAVRIVARKAMLAEPNIHTDGSIHLGEDIDLDIGGIGKGYIIDQAMAYLRQALPAAQGIKVDIGGDARYWGKPTKGKHWQVAVSDPNRTDDNAAALLHLILGEKAVTMSGHKHRQRNIDRHHYSHILAPRDGWPVEIAASSVVIANTATDADAAATALAAQAPADAIDWINTQEDLEALLILSDGRQLTSEKFAQYRSQSNDDNMARNFDFQLQYQIPDINAVDYQNPYVAVWISDKKRKTLRTLLLLGESERWATELSRWWRLSGRKQDNPIDGYARPTRRPGSYYLSWDGRDDFGNFLSPGDYILHLEAAREHAGRNYQTIPFSLPLVTQKKTFLAQEELGEIILKITGENKLAEIRNH
ncbi:DUF2271 domain-containing protein [Gilvimarinus polysaccharolyticus]|uniref:DUF2271 domain-containing protein n=1 Tax=Gilvimarinus polysaccharolyticus TaxID=863921 RepID=UPI0018DD6453|nr:DUF2271 domain-containing protein [Gilvimarinus polysaccharolyticus]